MAGEDYGEGLHAAFEWCILFPAISLDLTAANNGRVLDLVRVGLHLLEEMVTEVLVPHLANGEV